MASTADILKSVRLEIGDSVEAFRDSFRGNGEQTEWYLPARNILPDSLSVYTVDAGGITTLSSSDYVLNTELGLINFLVAPETDVRVVVEGRAFGIFSDDELETFIEAALSQHMQGRTVDHRYRDGHGFIKYDREEMSLAQLPVQENILVVLLASIEALWALSTDASMDIDVQTAEGTSIPRGQRHRQLIAQIELLTNKYKELSLMMGVGLFAPEVLPLRRISRTTGRLVPIFRSREYDETGPPVRKNIPVNTKGDDPDGPSSPWNSGGWGF